jgi:hypothetical protein
MNERRMAERIPVATGALVYFGLKRGVFAGMVCNMTEFGAKIQFGGLPIPKRFALSFDNFATVRRCRVAWKKGGFAGVAFEETAAKRPNNAMPLGH